MLLQQAFVSLIVACYAVPLNINLGAYSPALVVGDGEISLGSSESASELMATLASGAANNANGEQQQQGQQAAEQPPPQEPPAEQPAEENAAKRSADPKPNLVRTIEHFGKRAPAVDEHLAAVESAMDWIKRDLEGFNAALAYAREAMKNTPKIELGSEGAGVGIVVSPGLNVPANSASNGEAPERKVKRDAVVEEESEAPKMTLIAISEV